MAVEQSGYPVNLRGELTIPPSRGWWLLKWLLGIPHYVVLVFLWIAYIVVWVIAFFAILFTARFPRGFFDFNVGVLRWTWRMAFYSYGALGTDRYPPFSLDPDPDYPADLEVEYPETLSRGLVLVKWWLLAIPHWIIISVFVGAWSWSAGKLDFGGEGAGLIFILVLFAAVFLLFTGRYYQPFFRLIIGLNRWAFRVCSYVSLMTDRYPPFRLWDD